LAIEVSYYYGNIGKFGLAHGMRDNGNPFSRNILSELQNKASHLWHKYIAA